MSGSIKREISVNNDRFVVFDVETPNRFNDRMSAIGITIVENGIITDSFFSYVNPETFFDTINTSLTGIDADNVSTAPTFPELWGTIEPIFSSGILVAHNAVFDMGVLNKCLADYNISWKGAVLYCCTVQMGRRLLPGIRHGLNYLCDYYGIELDHHKADSDSMAAAQILIRYMESGTDVRRFMKKYWLSYSSASGMGNNKRPGGRMDGSGVQMMVQERFVEKRMDRLNLTAYLTTSQDVNILISGSYNKESGVGEYKGLLCYKQHRKYITGIVEDGKSPNFTMIRGLVDGINRVRLKNVNICVISGIHMGFKGAVMGKGLYAAELAELMRLAEAQGNKISSIAITDGSAEIKRIISRYLKQD